MAYNNSVQEYVLLAMGAQAAGSSAVNGNSIDLTATPADNVRFICALGALTATQVTNLKIQSSPDNSVWTDVTGSQTANAADADSNKFLLSEWIRPSTRYVRCVVNRSTANAVIVSVYALLGKARTEPVTQLTAQVSQSIVAGPGL